MHPKITVFSFLVLNLLILFICESQSQYEEFLNSYDLLSTIAGKGDIDGGGENGWLPQYEGGLATDAELSRPHMAMADAAGNIFIADKDAHAIRKIDIQGIISTVAGTSVAGDGIEGLATEQPLNAPNGLWVNDEGAFYILDLNNNKIRKVDTEGNMTTIVNDESGIALGRGLWLSDSEDTIWYAGGSQIKMWTESSGITPYATGFSGLGNITQDPDGFIVATDRTADQVYRISKDGTKEVIAGNGAASGGGDGYPALETGLDGVRGVWFLEDGTYFLATHEGSQVWHIDNDGTAHLFLNGSEGDEFHSGDGENYRTPGYKISEARAISVDFQGNVLVTENDRGFIRKILKKDVDAILNRSINNRSEILIYPNPVNSQTKIEYEISSPTMVSIKVYSSKGELVKIIPDKFQTAGTYAIEWQRNDLPSDTYYLIFKTAFTSVSARVILIK